MTVPVALLVLAATVAFLVLFTAPHVPRLFRHGHAPPRPRRLWVTLVVAREFAVATGACAAAWVVIAEGRSPQAWAAGAGVGALAFLVGEALVPLVGSWLPDRVADRVGDMLGRGLAPLRRPLERPAVVVAGWLAGEAGFAPTSILRFASDGAVEEGEEAALGDAGRTLLERLRAFRQRPVRAVMTPRLRSVALPVDAPGPVVLSALREHRFSRVPVYRDEPEDVIGVLYAKDLCGVDVAAPGFRLEPLIRPPIFIPVGTPAAEVFRELRRRKVHLALVVDEYGGLAGLVTMEDVLDELFGDIQDGDRDGRDAPEPE